MDIMMRLKGAGFSAIANAFREREKKLGGGLPLVDFVEIVLRGLPRPKSIEEKTECVSALVDLFDDIDINGDGAMEFEEFTSFCVDAGMVASRNQAGTLKHRYERDAKHALKTTAVVTSGNTNSHSSTSSTSLLNPLSTSIEKIKWSPGFRMFLVLENTARSIKIFTSEGNFVTEVYVTSGKQNQSQTTGGASSATPAGNGGAPVNDVLIVGEGVSFVTPTTATPPSASSISILDAVFIHPFRWLAISTSDFAISFYDMSEKSRSATQTSSASNANFNLLPNLGLTTTTAQLMLRFCDSSALLAGSGNDFVVNIWKIEDADTKVLWHRLSGHLDLVMDTLAIRPHDLLVTCDIRHSIQLWDLNDGRARGSLPGHERGVRQLCYSRQHDLLLSASFEFEALAWDLGSRQIVLRLSGHRAPLVGVQLALFQTERAITADCQGVFKVWDITRGNVNSSAASTSQAVQLESIDLGMPSTRVEIISFVCMHPHNRDLWVVTSSSCTLQRLRSTRVQQFDEVPLRAFYNYGANKFVVVAASVCSLWDGDTGSCTEEFTNVGNLNTFVGGSGAAGSASKNMSSSTTTPGTPARSADIGMPPSASSSQANRNEPGTELMICTHDTNCRKLVVVTEMGVLGVFNSQNFVQMRHCQESFLSNSQRRISVAGRPLLNSAPSCGVVGLHYCSENKLVIITDAGPSSITVIDDHSNPDSSKGISVLRKLINIPGGITASAYSFHASMIATVAADPAGMVISLWDFETLGLLGNCRYDQDNNNRASPSAAPKYHSSLTIQVLEFWDEFPILLAADSIGGVYFFAVTPLLHAYTGKLLHAFANEHDTTRQRGRKSLTRLKSDIMDRNEDDDQDNDTNGSQDVMLEAAKGAAHKMLQSSTFRRKNALTAVPEIKPEDNSSTNSAPPTTPLETSTVVTCMKMVFEEESGRYLLFVGDEKGYVGVWDPAPMIRRLTLAKIPEVKCKFLRRGYQPKAMFYRDFTKESMSTEGNNQKDKHRQAVSGSDWRGEMLLGEDLEHMNVRASQMDLKKLSRRRQESRAPRTPVVPGSSGSNTPKRSAQQQSKLTQPKETAVVKAVAAAEFLLSKNSSTTLSKRRSMLSLTQTQTTSDAASWPGSSCYENFPRDVTVVRRWQAHDDALTSLELSRHPNILVTCGLDMRVFVWNWDGECLGKLYDRDEQGSLVWRFRKDDVTRAKERALLVRGLLRELERSPAEKLEHRRKTIFSEHVGRRSMTDLRNVNAMLLEHITNKNPEIKLLEEEVKIRNSLTEVPDVSSTITTRKKVRSKTAGVRAVVLLPTKDPSTASQRQKLRLHSLNQVSPLRRAEKSGTAAATTSTDQLPFSATEDLKMDKAYLENELSITCPTSTSIRVTRTNQDADVQQQVLAEYESAQQALETRATLERKARGMYANLEGVKHRHGAHQLGSPGKGEQDGDPLEPSDFLKRHFPPSALSVRPLTAPVRALSSSTSVDRISSLGQNRRNGGVSKPLQISVSDSTLPQPGSALSNDSAGRRPSTASSLSVGERRKSSLDEMFIDQFQRHRQQQQQQRQSFDKDAHGSIVEGAEFDSEKQPPKPLQKLRGINDIIDKAHGIYNKEVVVDQRRKSLRPGTAPIVARHSLLATQSINALPENGAKPSESSTTKTIDGQVKVLRQHLEDTKHRMHDAMRDGERSVHQQNLRRLKQQALQKRQKRRLNGYLQQKHRGLTTNIGNVFKGLQADDGSEDDGDTAVVGTISSSGMKARAMLKSSAAQSPKGKGGAQLPDRGSMRMLAAKRTFGSYSVHEVMSVIRLFWSMDTDGSGNISLAELQHYQSVFEKLGFHNITTIVQTMDSNGDGQVSLRELLEICFQYANKSQIDGMLQLAKVGSVRSFLLGARGDDNSSVSGSPTGSKKSGKTRNYFAGGATGKLLPEHRDELMAIFRVFDHNGDGGVSMQEIMEALRVDDDDVMAAVMHRERDKAGQRFVSTDQVVSSGLTREDVEQIYHEFDRDQDATLDFDEFVSVMRNLVVSEIRFA